MINFIEVSKAISHALRHEPWLYELELDQEGWVPMEQMLSALHSEKPDWESLQESDLHTMMARSEKQRYEIQDGKIRALYGHSVPGKVTKTSTAPPLDFDSSIGGSMPPAPTNLKGLNRISNDKYAAMGKEFKRFEKLQSM